MIRWMVLHHREQFLVRGRVQALRLISSQSTQRIHREYVAGGARQSQIQWRRHRLVDDGSLRMKRAGLGRQ